MNPRHERLNAAALFLCLFTATPIAHLCAQDKLQVAPPAKSDTYAEDEQGRKFRVQNREVAGTNFQIAGVDLTATEEVLTQAERLLGKVETVATGDASTFLERACYRSMDANDSTRVIFERGEVSPSFVLTSENSAWKWKTPCRRTTKISRGLATASGLHLGQTQAQVIAILGLPTRRSRNIQNSRDDLVYELGAHKKTEPKELDRLLKQEMKQNPSFDPKVFHENYDFYYLSVLIRARFINDALTKLDVSWSATS